MQVFGNFIWICEKKAVILCSYLNVLIMKKIFFLLMMVSLTVSCKTPCSDGQPKVGTIGKDTILGVPCCVYLPYAYADRVRHEETLFPVLYLQHGMWGNENDWKEQGRLLAIMDSLLQRGLVREMVIVMPDNCPGRPTYEEEKENAMNGEWEANFAAFMAQTEQRYAVSTDPSQRAIAGLSMGGYHTQQVTMTLPNQFGFIGVFSALITPPYSMEGNEDALYWMAIGKDDFLYDTIQTYRRWLDTNHYEYTYYESAGGHEWPNWQDYICRFLQKLF